MNPDEARRRFARVRVAKLATVSASGQPHLVPITFAVLDDVIYTAVDSKPKTTARLRRFENVRQNPRVALLADFYDDADWTALWWVRAEGTGRILDSAEGSADEAKRAIDALTTRYAQYETHPPHSPVLAIDVDRWSGWSAS